MKEISFKINQLVRVCFANPNPLNVEIKIREAVAEVESLFQKHLETALSHKAEIEEHIPSNISNPEVTSTQPKKKK